MIKHSENLSIIGLGAHEHNERQTNNSLNKHPYSDLDFFFMCNILSEQET